MAEHNDYSSIYNWLIGRKMPGYAEDEVQQDPNSIGALRRQLLDNEWKSSGGIAAENANLAPYYRAGAADMHSRGLPTLDIAPVDHDPFQHQLIPVDHDPFDLDI